MDSQIFLVEFSNNDHIVTIDRCSHYDQLVRETVKAINGSIQAQDIDSYQYDALFGEECITITVKNSKALFRIPNKPYYKLKCIINLPQSNHQPLSITNKPTTNFQIDTAYKIIYKLPVSSRRLDSMKIFWIYFNCSNLYIIIYK